MESKYEPLQRRLEIASGFCLNKICKMSLHMKKQVFHENSYRFFALTEEILNGNLLFLLRICEIPKMQYFGLWVVENN